MSTEYKDTYLRIHTVETHGINVFECDGSFYAVCPVTGFADPAKPHPFRRGPLRATLGEAKRDGARMLSMALREAAEIWDRIAESKAQPSAEVEKS